MTETVIIRDKGFVAEDWTGSARPLSEGLAANADAVEIAPADDVDQLAGHLARLTMIRVSFPKSADGRGFTLARRLRAMGYTGRLRAVGNVLADQYAMARRSGFDEVEVSAALAARQPEDQWRARANWRAHDYQARLRG